MDFTSLFKKYYIEFRGDTDVPDIDDPEYEMGMTFANVAIARWNQVDGVLWNSLWTTRNTADDGDDTVIANQLVYDAPGDFVMPGGYVRLGGDQSVQRIQVVQPDEAQTMGGTFAYFTGNPSDGYQLNLSNVAGNIAGYAIDYDYYREPTEFESGGDVSECPDPLFLVHSMVADRFRAARNFPAYQTARRDADMALRNMITRNAMGNPTHGWQVRDSIPGFGANNNKFGI